MVYRRGYKEMFERNKWKIVRGDTVQVMVGKDKGQVGTVLKVIRNKQFPRVVVEGLNMVRRYVKRTKEHPGGPVSIETPISYSNVSLVDPVTNRPVRVTYRYLEDGTKVRVTKGKNASGSIIPRPEILKERRKLRPLAAGPKDTPADVASKVTYMPGEAHALPSDVLAAAGVQKGTPGARAYSTAALAAWAPVQRFVAAVVGLPLPAARSGAAPGGSQGFARWRGFAASALRAW